MAVARVAAARHAIDESETGIALTGRSEGFVCGRPDIEETIRRLCAYADAGADCLYAPRIDTARSGRCDRRRGFLQTGERIDRCAIRDGRRSCGPGSATDRVGGTLARTAWAGFLQAAQEIADSGSFSRFEMLPNVNAVFPRVSGRDPSAPACVGAAGWDGRDVPATVVAVQCDRTATTVRAN
jgi:hypothetical protein